jgi:hypothetical protein
VFDFGEGFFARLAACGFFLGMMARLEVLRAIEIRV